jgi:chromosomal replication initiation ATPase DnaA
MRTNTEIPIYDVPAFISYVHTKKLTIKEALVKAAEIMEIGLDDLLSRKRLRYLADRRTAIGAFLVKAYPEHTLEYIGSLLKRDHSTLTHYKKNVIEITEIRQLFIKLENSF